MTRSAPRTALAMVPLVLAAASMIARPTPAADVADDREAQRFFEERVRPILAEHCQRCHGEERQKSDLRLDSRAAALLGGHGGPAVVPGAIDESLLVEAVRYEGLEMPPDGPLGEEEVAALVRWVEIGAPWPGSDDSDAAVRQEPGTFTDEDRAYWAFRPIERVEPPAVADPDWCRNEIDRFIAARLDEAGLAPAPEADRRTLIRRATFDLHGLPPTPGEVDAFLADPADDAYERLVDRLLESPRYGERWGRHWLDLVRYAESNGYRADEYRPNAWRYRDYVVHAFNEDMPYDEFVREQVAGDELEPGDPTAKVATGYLRLWSYESNQRDVAGQWDAILDDVTDVTADVFLGLGMGCAKCHDHKYDPILQKDYYRLRSFFAALRPRDDLAVAPSGLGTGDDERRAAWEVMTADIRAQIAAIERPYREKAEREAVTKFQPDMQALLTMDPSAWSPREQQLAELAYRQVQLEFDRVPDKLKDEDEAKRKELVEQLRAYDFLRPAEPDVDTISDLGPVADPMTIPGDRSGAAIEPGFLSILDPEPADLCTPGGWPDSTGRRTTLARWLTRPENPLTTRVIVNRLWHYHYGRGIVETTSDFGRLGEPPSHPELLDWLATRLVDEGWSLKAIHRLMMTSATYRQASRRADRDSCVAVDPEDALFWSMPVRRLEAEPIRDAMLLVSGELDPSTGGPSVNPEKPRRSVYTRFVRNSKDPLLGAFDVADGYSSTGERNVTTTPTQSLLMINGEWTLGRAEAFADRLAREGSEDPAGRIDLAFRLAFGRPADAAEVEAALAFLGEQSHRLHEGAEVASNCEAGAGHAIDDRAWADLCHVLLNANEFLYVD